MSTIVQKFQNATEKIESGNIADLKQGLQTIASIPKQQLQANKSTISFPLVQFTDAVNRSIKVNSQQISPSDGIRQQIRKVAQNLPTSMKRQIIPIMNNLQRETRKAQLTNQVQEVLEQKNNNEQRRIATAQINSNSLISTSKTKVYANSTITPIQRSVQQLRPLFQMQIPNATNQDQLPQTMRFLSRYAQLKNTIPVGSVTNQRGNAYVGVRVIQNNGMRQLLPFQKNGIPRTNTPSISSRLQYHANRTINSWNTYVQQQSNFVNFIQKVSTPQSRLKYVQTQFKTMNLQTFSAEVIATISHYYVYIPMLKMVSKMTSNPQINPTLSGFLAHYQTGTVPKDNPLMLSNGQGKQLARLLFTMNKPPATVCVEITALLVNVRNSLNEKQMKTLETYSEKKMMESKNYLNQNGIADVLVQSVLAANDWSSVKKKKFVITGGETNPQITQIAKKIIKQGSAQTKIKNFNLIWGGSDLISHDYIWGWNQK